MATPLNTNSSQTNTPPDPSTNNPAPEATTTQSASDSESSAPEKNSAPADVVSRSEFEQALTKARQQEHQKLSGTIEQQRAENAKLAEQVQTMASQLQTLTNQKTAEEEAGMSESELLDKRVQEMQQQIAESNQKQAELLSAFEKQQAELKATRQAAADMIEAERVKSHRTKVMTELGIKSEFFQSKVTGSTIAEVDASAKAAVEEIERIKKEAVQEALQQQRQTNAQNLPSPIGVNRLNLDSASPYANMTREELGRLPPEEYKKARAEIMAEIKQRRQGR